MVFQAQILGPARENHLENRKIDLNFVIFKENRAGRICNFVFRLPIMHFCISVCLKSAEIMKELPADQGRRVR